METRSWNFCLSIVQLLNLLTFIILKMCNYVGYKEEHSKQPTTTNDKHTRIIHV